MTCQICCQDYTEKKRKIIKCPRCQGEHCLECFKTNLLTREEFSTNCIFPECEKVYSYIEIATITENKSFVKDLLKKLTEETIKSEKQKLPETQWYAQERIEKEQLENSKELIKGTIKFLKSKIRSLERLSLQETMLHHNKFRNPPEDNAEIYTFVKECSHPGCNGMLNKSWQCGICKEYTCAKCHGPKAERDDRNHICDEDTVKSLTTIKKESKPCPECGIGISKVDGCDQMWCPKCKTAFSWRTGKRDHGYIHNPEWFRYMRENDINIPRNPNDAGGCQVDLYDIRFNIRNCSYIYRELNLAIYEITRFSLHLRYDINHFNDIIDEEKSKRELRIDYLTSKKEKEEIEKIWLDKLRRIIKLNKYNREIFSHIQTLDNITNNILHNINTIFLNSDIKREEKIKQIIAQEENFIHWLEIINKNFIDCAKLFGFVKKNYILKTIVKDRVKYITSISNLATVY
jgi:hypothetical protein